MKNFPSPEQLSNIPSLGETRGILLRDTIIHLHFSIGKVNFCDWYVAEFDGMDTFWGYVILLHDHNNARWRKILYSGLKQIRIRHDLEVDLDVHWKLKKASEIPRIRNF